MPIPDSLRKSLKSGLSATAAARRARCSRRYAFQFAAKEGLPTNPPIAPHSKDEHRLLLSLHRDTRKKTLSKFRLSEAALSKIESRLKNRK